MEYTAICLCIFSVLIELFVVNMKLGKIIDILENFYEDEDEEE